MAASWLLTNRLEAGATYSQFDALYRKYSGKAYGSWRLTPRLNLGLSYRVVQVPSPTLPTGAYP